MRMRPFALLFPFLLLVTACNDDALDHRDMIVIARHYPAYLNCGFFLELAVNRIPALEDTRVSPKEGAVTCEDFGRDTNSSTLGQACYMRDMGADTNDTCLIGSNLSNSVEDAAALVESIIGTAQEANTTK